MLACQNFSEAAYRFRERNEFAIGAREYLRDAERLGEETLDFARTVDQFLVFFR